MRQFIVCCFVGLAFAAPAAAVAAFVPVTTTTTSTTQKFVPSHHRSFYLPTTTASRTSVQLWEQQRNQEEVIGTVEAIQSSSAAASATPTTTITSSSSGDGDGDWDSITTQLLEEAKEIYDCAKLAWGPIFESDVDDKNKVSVDTIVELCDEIDAQLEQQQLSSSSSSSVTTKTLITQSRFQLRRRALEARRYGLLAKLMRQDYSAYVNVASFLSPSRIPRDQLPNVQDIPYTAATKKEQQQQQLLDDETGLPLVPDCQVQDLVYKDSLLDNMLLSIFRKLVTQNTGGVVSDKPGILGLVEQGRSFMLQPNQTPEAQHTMVSDTLAGLMTPVLPPFYRIFMSGIVPDVIANAGGADSEQKKERVQLGPWFYAPWLTSVVTPTFFAFLVGPSRPNRRKDGKLGGLVVEKCKFLQESGCKGLCLHQCKLPAQQFFQQELGLALTVSPNFVTQECQWSFGEEPLPPNEDPSFPKGCLVGCESRQRLVAAVAAGGTRRTADLCSA